jgi:translation initiation factor IF-2
MAEVKILRLAKAGATYNVSTEHIIEALNKAKFELDSNPNFKLTPDMIAVLDKEFGADKAIKQQAEISKPVEKPKKEVPVAPPVEVVAPPIKEEEPEAVEKELLVKNNLAAKPELPDLISAEKVTLEGPNIIGKIDLDKPKKTTKKATKEEVVEEKQEEKPAVKKPKKEETPDSSSCSANGC